MAEKPKAVVHEAWTGTCPASMVCVSENGALCILIANIFGVNLGTLIASCMDENGCNCQTFLLCWLQGALAGIIIGWLWAIKWAMDVKDWNKARLAYIAGGG